MQRADALTISCHSGPGAPLRTNRISQQQHQHNLECVFKSNISARRVLYFCILLVRSFAIRLIMYGIYLRARGNRLKCSAAEMRCAAGEKHTLSGRARPRGNGNKKSGTQHTNIMLLVCARNVVVTSKYVYSVYVGTHVTIAIRPHLSRGCPTCMRITSSTSLERGMLAESWPRASRGAHFGHAQLKLGVSCVLLY